MSNVLLIGQLLVLLALAALGWGFLRLRHSTLLLEQRCAELDPLGQAAPPDLSALFAGGTREVLVIEILNPMEVAAQESRLASTVGTLTPALVRREVYRQAVPIVIEEMKKHGIVADVQVRRAA